MLDSITKVEKAMKAAEPFCGSRGLGNRASVRCYACGQSVIRILFNFIKLFSLAPCSPFRLGIGSFHPFLGRGE